MRLSQGLEEDLVENTDINITPFIDVMLVLLIIFMVAAPLSTVDTPVTLPKAAGTAQARPDSRLMVTLTRDLGVQIDGQPVAAADLAARLAQTAAKDAQLPVFVAADEGVSYGALMGVMNSLRDAGFARIGLVGLERDPGSAAP